MGSIKLIERQTYLSEYIDDGTFGHLSLGRSFALDMGCTIPSTDQRLSKFLAAVPRPRLTSRSCN